ncbi:uncharacterized protein K452DRAFT_1743 [Aplosporella prunicola CBS 121167]|uniref:Uncharacterized protein n=1 Tax=Aplosporella prunicola CBS 121167 TaxID=1176127 RepID=A0A6A6BUS4_9PEZI|nr:uncharacterized protein K452DRAFT_1743 [Aplosporella prunicola CBS 121167]KAF2147103.1 hypothetical protein K452DRAFT_1743 [Aplosporella prunicola CBS 121167]
MAVGKKEESREKTARVRQASQSVTIVSRCHGRLLILRQRSRRTHARNAAQHSALGSGQWRRSSGLHTLSPRKPKHSTVTLVAGKGGRQGPKCQPHHCCCSQTKACRRLYRPAYCLAACRKKQACGCASDAGAPAASPLHHVMACAGKALQKSVAGQLQLRSRWKYISDDRPPTVCCMCVCSPPTYSLAPTTTCSKSRRGSFAAPVVTCRPGSLPVPTYLPT